VLDRGVPRRDPDIRKVRPGWQDDATLAQLLGAAPYEFIAANRDFLGLVMHGLSANAALLEARQSRTSYDFDPKEDAVTVLVTTPMGRRRLPSGRSRETGLLHRSPATARTSS
jgi:hypothetical protein